MTEDLQEKIQELELSRINIRVSPAVFDRLLKIAELKGLSIEEYSAQTLRDSLDEKIGGPIITGPGKLNGSDAQKITGPSFSTRRFS